MNSGQALPDPRVGVRRLRFGTAAAVWRRLRSPLLMVATVVLLEFLGGSQLSRTSRSVAYIVVVAIAAATDGRLAALIAGLIAGSYLAFWPLLGGPSPGSSNDGVLVLLATIPLAVIVGGIRELHDLAVAQLQREQERLRRTLRTNTEFMSAAAHELRTPVTVVLGYLSLLDEGSLGSPSPAWKSVIEIVAGKARELGSLVDQMLLSARLDSGTAPTVSGVLDLREAVRQAVERADPRATVLRATLSYELPSRSVLVLADPDHVAIILDNLIGNALTYSDDPPWVKVTVAEQEDAQVLVQDRGYGIPPDLQESIFDRLVRVRDPGHQPRPGTGMGLAISRDLAQRHAGSVTLVSSEAAAGSVFALRLPRLRARTAA